MKDEDDRRAADFIAAGVPLPMVQKLLGHASIDETIRRYGHLLSDSTVGPT